MIDMNLLPKKPFIIRHRAMLYFLVIVLGAGMLAGQWYLYQSWEGARAVTEQANAEMTARLAAEEKKRQVDEFTENYLQAEQAVERLKKDRQDWLPLIAVLIGPLPDKARIVQLSAAKEGEIDVQLRLPSYDSSVAYLRYIEQSALIGRTELKEFTAGAPASGGDDELLDLLQKDAGGGGTSGAADAASGSADSAAAEYTMALELTLQSAEDGGQNR